MERNSPVVPSAYVVREGNSEEVPVLDLQLICPIGLTWHVFLMVRLPCLACEGGSKPDERSEVNRRSFSP